MWSLASNRQRWRSPLMDGCSVISFNMNAFLPSVNSQTDFPRADTGEQWLEAGLENAVGAALDLQGRPSPWLKSTKRKVIITIFIITASAWSSSAVCRTTFCFQLEKPANDSQFALRMEDETTEDELCNHPLLNPSQCLVMYHLTLIFPFASIFDLVVVWYLWKIFLVPVLYSFLHCLSLSFLPFFVRPLPSFSSYLLLLLISDCGLRPC